MVIRVSTALTRFYTTYQSLVARHKSQNPYHRRSTIAGDLKLHVCYPTLELVARNPSRPALVELVTGDSQLKQPICLLALHDVRTESGARVSVWPYSQAAMVEVTRCTHEWHHHNHRPKMEPPSHPEASRRTSTIYARLFCSRPEARKIKKRSSLPIPESAPESAHQASSQATATRHGEEECIQVQAVSPNSSRS